MGLVYEIGNVMEETNKGKKKERKNRNKERKKKKNDTNACN